MFSYTEILRQMCHMSHNFYRFTQTGRSEDFFTFYENDLDGYDNFNIIIDSKEVSVHVSNGKTKACVHVEGADTVAKIGFSDFRVNHVLRELEIYSEAERVGVSEILVYTHYLLKLNNVDVIESDFVECDCDGQSVVSDVYDKCSDSMSDDDITEMIDYGDGLFETLFSFYYSVSTIDRALWFIMDYEVNDLHCANMGYDRNGKIKLIDYSGYFPEKSYVKLEY